MRQGDDAVMADQAFLIYSLVVQAVGGHPIQVPLRDYTHDLDAMAGPSRRARGWSSSPIRTIPTGTIVRRDGWRRSSRTLRGRELVVVADEAYADTSRIRRTRTPCTSGRRQRRRGDAAHLLEALRAGGLRVGYAVAPPPVIDLPARVRQPFNVNGLAQVGALAALDDTEHVERTLATNREGMAYLERRSQRLNVRSSRARRTSCWCASARARRLRRAAAARRDHAPDGRLRLSRSSCASPSARRGEPRFVEALAAVLRERRDA
jgi:histidinol-phosphate aminotransferase